MGSLIGRGIGGIKTGEMIRFGNVHGRRVSEERPVWSQRLALLPASTVGEREGLTAGHREGVSLGSQLLGALGMGAAGEGEETIEL